MQSDATTANDLATQIGAVTDVFGWNGAPDSSNFSLGNGTPVIVQGASSTPAFWPGFQNGLITWSQTYGAQRDILIQWQTNDGEWPPQPYLVERREIGAASWDVVGEVAFPGSSAEMQERLATTFEILQIDLRDNENDPPLSPNEVYEKLERDPNLAALLAQNYADVSLATGRGFLDTNVEPLNYEYRVSPISRSSNALALDPVCAPFSATPAYTLTGLRDSNTVNLAYAAHGIRNEEHPTNAANRYEWGAYQQTRLMEGRTALIWDNPVENFAPPTARSGCVELPESAGATFVLRKKPARIPAAPYELVNEMTDGGGLLGVRPGAALATNDPHGETYYFSEYIVADNPEQDPNDLYIDWEYQVCAVNALGEELDCSLHETTVREFDSPAAIETQEITLPADHSKLTLTFTYSDTSEISFPLTAYIMRADSATTALDRWTDIDAVEIADGALNTYSVDDVPPLGETQWYRVQVVDAAGNWSPPSPPIFWHTLRPFDRAVPKCI